MKRILFVDDERNILDGIRRMLYPDRDRWCLSFATGGQEALRLCEQISFDVVVSDLRMAGMDGAELLGHIRALYPGTARIILSGYSEVALAARAAPVAYRVIAKPCKADQLRKTIDRVCALQDLLCQPALRDVIGALGELPSLSSAYFALSEALRDVDTPISVIAQIIEKDVAMCAKVLQLVNSGFFGLPQKAPNLEFAVSYLGIETIRTLALCSEAFRVFVCDPRIPKSLWPQVQARSERAASIVATFPMSQEDRDVAFLAALLHDVGTLVLAATMPSQFCAVLADMKETNCSQYEAEELLLGTSHAEVGAYLLGLWGINRTAVEAIAHHHHPARGPSAEFDCTTAVYLSSLLADEIDAHPDDVDGKNLSQRDSRDLDALGLREQFNHYRRITGESMRASDRNDLSHRRL